ncbi:hypothetical protein QOZ80_6AG0512510 [Eleusine coracana subsp. coracana]|nr:hypothetical protein QOZ80_6AG0512510 [Eleusine coracana subsp. coracana]
MSSRKKCNRAVAQAGASAKGIDALPEGLLNHILGFIDARQAVQTCVLARRWRHLWKSATTVCIGTTNPEEILSFMEHLLLLRGGSQFDVFSLGFHEFEDSHVPHVKLWIRHALLCKVQELKFGCISRSFPLDGLPLVSQHLRILRLINVVLMNKLCDFSGCPSLEHIDIFSCVLPCVKKISSLSVKHLSIKHCMFNGNQGVRTHICAPSLVSLILDVNECPDEELCRTPVLDSMPSLRDAFVTLAQKNADCCTHADESGNCSNVNWNSCYGIEHDNNCLLLEGLSEAENLKLMAE